MWWKLKNTILQVCTESGHSGILKRIVIHVKKQKRQLGKIFQAVVLRHVWNQCLGVSKQLLMPKDVSKSTNFIEKIGFLIFKNQLLFISNFMASY